MGNCSGSFVTASRLHRDVGTGADEVRVGAAVGAGASSVNRCQFVSGNGYSGTLGPTHLPIHAHAHMHTCTHAHGLRARPPTRTGSRGGVAFDGVAGYPYYQADAAPPLQNLGLRTLLPPSDNVGICHLVIRLCQLSERLLCSRHGFFG